MSELALKRIRQAKAVMPTILILYFAHLNEIPFL